MNRDLPVRVAHERPAGGCTLWRTMRLKLLIVVTCSVWSVASNAQAVLDQITGSDSLGKGLASQVFGDEPQYDASSVDNYVGAGVIIGVDCGFGTQDIAGVFLQNNPVFRISTYATFGDAVAGNASDTVDTANWIFDPIYNLSITNFGVLKFSGLQLNAPNDGWIGVQAIADFDPNGQFYILDSLSGTPGDNNAEIVNPNGGFGLPGNHAAFHDFQGYYGNASYRIQSIVPEPSLAAVSGVCLIGLVARRRRQ